MLKKGGLGGIEGISGAISLHRRFLSSNEASREISEIPQQGTTFSSCLPHLFSPVSSWQQSLSSPSKASGSGAFPALLCRDIWERRLGSWELQSLCRATGRPTHTHLSPLAPSCPAYHKLQPCLRDLANTCASLHRNRSTYSHAQAQKNENV